LGTLGAGSTACEGRYSIGSSGFDEEVVALGVLECHLPDLDTLAIADGHLVVREERRVQVEELKQLTWCFVIDRPGLEDGVSDHREVPHRQGARSTRLVLIVTALSLYSHRSRELGGEAVRRSLLGERPVGCADSGCTARLPSASRPPTRASRLVDVRPELVGTEIQPMRTIWLPELQAFDQAELEWQMMRRGLQPFQLAEIAGVSASTLYRALSGHRTQRRNAFAILTALSRLPVVIGAGRHRWS
jgi:hypothetical protein